MVLFDDSCSEVADSVRSTLVSQCRQLKHLKILFEEALAITRNSWRHASATSSIAEKCQITDLVQHYTEAILWFLNSKLLPEKASAFFEDFFPARELQSVYARKREQLCGKIKEWMADNDLSEAPEMNNVGLLVDGLCAPLQPQIVVNFEREGGNGPFPPPTLHALLISYLIHSPSSTAASDLMIKHRLVQYLFLDMASCLSKKEPQSEEELAIVDNLIKFPSAFSVPPSFIKLTQVCIDFIVGGAFVTQLTSSKMITNISTVFKLVNRNADINKTEKGYVSVCYHDYK